MRLAQPTYITGSDLDTALNILNSRDRAMLTAPVSEFTVNAENGSLEYGGSSFVMTPHAAKQLAMRLKITPGYVLKIPNDLSARNYNDFLQNAPGNIQVAIENGDTITAILKEKTTPIDPSLLIDVIEDRLRNNDLSIGKWWFNDEGMTFRLNSEKFQVEPKVGDAVRAGVDIMVRENSEATLGMRGTLFRLSCLNGAVAEEPIELRRQILKDGWRDQASRLSIAAEAIDWNLTSVYELGQNLKKMATMEINFPSEAKDRAAYIKMGLAGINPATLGSKGFTETIAEASYQEDSSLFGLYNAITRIGRDSLDRRIKEVFERGSYSIVNNPDFVMENLATAGTEW